MALQHDNGISVLLSVYRDASAIEKTIHSVFAQYKEAANVNREVEFIIVDDGADELVKSRLQNLQKQYPKLIIHKQENQGLTRALTTGCKLATQPYIARIDAGDIMLTGRLAKQSELLDKDPKLALISSWTSYQTQEGDFLYDVKQSTEEVQRSLDLNPLNSYISPQHFAVMFRKSMYDAVGGYRPEFYFAQDFDLWLRLSELGSVEVISQSLTSSELTGHAISGAYSQEQSELLDLAVISASLRRKGVSDNEVLEKVSQIRPKQSAITQSSQTRALYFIASCLLANSVSKTGSDAKKAKLAARRYFLRAVNVSPFNLMAYIGIVRSFF